MTGRVQTWLTLGVSLIVVVALGFALVAWRAHRSLSDRPDEVLAALSRAVGLPVEADGVRVTWWPPGLVVRGIRVPDESPLGPGQIVHADEARLVVRALPLLSGTVVVKRIEVSSPVVRLVRGVGGGWNFAGRLPWETEADAVSVEPTLVKSSVEARFAASAPPHEFRDVADVVVTRGRVSLRDRAITGVPEFEITGLDARLRRKNGAATLDLAGTTLGGPGQNLRGRMQVPAEGKDVTLSISADAVPARRLREVMQLVRGGIPFGAALDGAVSAEITGQLPAQWPPGQAAIGVLLDATDASATMAGGYVRKAVGAPLAMALELRAGPRLLQIRSATFESGEARIELASSEPADPAAAVQPALRVASANLTAALLSRWVPLLTAIEPVGALSLRGTLAPAESGTAASLRLSGADLAARIGRNPAEVGAAAVAFDLVPEGRFSAGVSIEALRSEDLFAHRLTAAFEGGADTPVSIRVDGVRGGRGRAEVQRLAIECEVDGDRADVRRFELAGLGGTVHAQGEFARGDGDALSMRVAPKWDGLDFAGLVQLLGYEVDVQGLFTGEAALVARQSAEETLLETLSGAFDMQLANGEVADLNLARVTVDNLNSIPGLRDVFERYSKEKVPTLLAQTTHIDSLSVEGTVGDGVVAVANLRLDAPIYSIDAVGNVGLGGDVDLDGDLVLDQETTEALVSVSALLSALAVDGGLIRIPVTIGGTYPDLVSAPSPAFVTEAIAKHVSTETGGGAQDLLRRLFGGGGGGGADRAASDD